MAAMAGGGACKCANLAVSHFRYARIGSPASSQSKRKEEIGKHVWFSAADEKKGTDTNN